MIYSHCGHNLSKKGCDGMWYETFATPSWDDSKCWDHKPGKTYTCAYCDIEMEDHETFMVSGKTYCCTCFRME